MKRTSTFFRSLAAPAVLAGFTIASCGNHGEDDWRLGESRETVTNGDNLLADMAAAAAEGEFRIRVPLGVDRSAIALGAAGKLTLGRGSRVNASGGGFSTVNGIDGVELGESSQVGSIYSAGKAGVVLGDKSVVNGFIRSAAGVRQAATARIEQGVIDRDASQTEEIRWRVKFPGEGGSDQIAHAGDPTLLDLKPGAYGTVVVEKGATAIIHSGAYYFRSLELQPGSIVEIDNGYGPVFLWVRESLALGGTMMEYEAAKSNVLIGYAGSAAPAITGALRGTLVAPAAEVALPAGDKSHLGAVFARSVRVADGAVIDHRAFEGADVDYAAAPDYHSCVTQCQTVYMTNTNQCGNTYTTNISACDNQYISCSAGSAVSCAGAAAAGPAAYAACMIAVIANTCQIAARNCYATSAPPFQTCINQQNQARTTCNTTCH